MNLALGRPYADLPWFQLVLFSFACQLLVIQAVGRSDLAGDLMPFLLPASHLLLLPFLIRNFGYWGMRLVLAGLLLNMVVMAANGGLMPVDAAAVDAVGRHEVSDLSLNEPVAGTKNVLLSSDDIQLRALSDGMILPLPRPLTKAVSVGDILVAPGIAIALYEVIRKRMQNEAVSLAENSA